MSKPAGSLYEFGPFRLDPQERLLVRDGQPLSVTPKAFDTLVFLIENNGHLIAKNTLMQAIWPDTFVEEVNLSQNVSLLRKVLGDTPQEQRYIQTVAGRGYRFCAEVRSIEAEETGGTSESVIVESHTQSRLVIEESHIWDRRVMAVMVLLLAVAAGAGVYQVWSHYHSSRAPGRNGSPIMLAVLPLENLIPDGEQDYFSDGLTQELTTELGRLDSRQLGVVARTSVLRYKHSSEAVKQIADELGVQYLLEGSVGQESSKLLISLKLISAPSGARLWANTYELPKEDVRQMEAEIVRAVAGQVGLKLTAQEKSLLDSREAVNPQSYDAYLRGRYFWEKRDAEGYRQALQAFRTAVQEDSSNAPGYAGLADTYLLLGGYGVMPQQEAVPLAEMAARQALQIDPTLAEAHTALGKIAENYRWDWATADTEYQRALKLDPNYALGHHWYAEYLASVGRLPEAIGEMRRAEELDPMSPIVYSDAGKIYWFARDNRQALEQDRKALALDPRFTLAHVNVGLALLAQGSPQQAIAELENARKWDDTPLTLSVLGYCYATAGQKMQAEGVLRQLSRLSDHDALDPSFFGRIYIALGDKDRAFTWLEAEYTIHSAALNRIKVSPIYDPLRSDPRFNDLLRRMRLN